MDTPQSRLSSSRVSQELQNTREKKLRPKLLLLNDTHTHRVQHFNKRTGEHGRQDQLHRGNKGPSKWSALALIKLCIFNIVGIK